MKVYQAINKVQTELAKTGISKARNNQAQGYKFRGIDDVYNAISSLMAEAGLCILPRMLSREVVERVNNKGTALFYVTVDAEFDLVAAEDGSKHTVKTYGEAMDSGDKATNKAMSAAYKYAVMQAFAIPTEGDNDADSHTHEVKPKGRELIPEVTPLSDSDASALLVAVESADTTNSLKAAFGAAYSAAKAANSQPYLTLFKSAYDARKKSLEVAA